MTKYLVIEIQTMDNGSVGNFVWAFDDKLSAESKMHSILSVAAETKLPRHAAILIDNAGSRLDGKCYVHEEPVDEVEL